MSHTAQVPLVDLDGTENRADKPQGSQRANGTSHQQHGGTDQTHVAKVQEVRHEHTRSLQGLEPEHTVDKGVQSSRSRGEKGKPPPAVILGAELPVHQQDRDFCAGNEHDKVNNEGESKDIIVLAHPQTSHNEKKLDVFRRQRKETSNHYAHRGMKDRF